MNIIRNQALLWRFALALALASAPICMAAGEPKAHVDHEGNPLPPEAVARVGSTRLRPGGMIRALAYTADGKTIVSATLEGSIQLWDAGTGKLRHTANIPEKAAYRQVLAVEGKIIHLFFSPGVYRALDADTGKELRQVKLADAANPAFTAMTPDGTTLAITYGDGTLRLIDLTNGKTSLTLKLDGDEIYSLAFSRDGKLLALGDAAGQVRLLDAATGNVRVQIPTPLKAVQHLAFAPDGKKLLTTGYVEEPAIVWNVPAGTELCRLAWDAKWLVFCSAFSPDSRCVALGSHQRYLPLYDVATGKEVRRFGPQSSSLCLAFTADGKTLAAGSNAGEIGQWEVATGKRLPASAEPLGGVQALRFTDGGKHLLVAGTAHAVYEWKTGRLVRQYPAAPTEVADSAALSPDGSLLAFQERGGRLVLWNTNTGKEQCSFKNAGSFWFAPLFTPDGKRLMAADWGGPIRVWDVAASNLLHELKSHTAFASALAVSSDGRWLASASNVGRNRDQAVRLWDLQTGHLLHQFLSDRDDLQRLAFSADGSVLAVTAMGSHRSKLAATVFLVDVATGTTRQSLPCDKVPALSLAFSPDSRTLATGSFAGPLCLWELATGKERHRFGGHAGEVTAVVCSADGTLLAASSSDAPLLIWDVYGKHATPPAPRPPMKVSACGRIWRARTRRLRFSPFAASLAMLAPLSRCCARLKPAEAADAKRLQQWLKDLDSEEFDVRQAADAELAKLGDRIETPLRQRLKPGSRWRRNGGCRRC